MALYDAFISYSHAKDKPIAAALAIRDAEARKALAQAARFARVPRRHEPIRYAPALALDRAKRLPIPLSLAARLARSRRLALGRQGGGVWLTHKSADTLLIGVTDGALSWNEKKATSTGSPSHAASTRAQGPLHGRAEMGPPLAYRDGANTARRALHRARR